MQTILTSGGYNSDESDDTDDNDSELESDVDSVDDEDDNDAWIKRHTRFDTYSLEHIK